MKEIEPDISKFVLLQEERSESVTDCHAWRDGARKQTEFSQYQDEYFLNKDNKLEKYPAPRDCQALIDSCAETVYQKILDALSEPLHQSENVASGFVARRDAMLTDLDLLLDSDQVVDEIREAYKLGDVSKAEVIKYLQTESAKDFREYTLEQERRKANEKADQTQSESKQEELPKDGTEGSQA